MPVATPAAARLTVRGVGKSFRAQVLDGVDLDVAPGEILALTGPSGAGKTTLCRILAGLERPDQGALRLGDGDLLAIPAGRRHVAFLFESYALYPHLTVRQNALSPLQAPNVRADLATANRRVDEVLELLEIRQLDARLPGALSGGQKQRAALARTLVQQPALFLLDEPISHLDAKLRHKLRGEIRRRLASQPAPAIWATPDGMEALSVGDRVAVIDGGRDRAGRHAGGDLAEPGEHPRRPPARRSPMNLVPGTLVEEGGARCFARRELRLPLPAPLAHAAGLSDERRAWCSACAPMR